MKYANLTYTVNCGTASTYRAFHLIYLCYDSNEEKCTITSQSCIIQKEYIKFIINIFIFYVYLLSENCHEKIGNAGEAWN